MKKIYTLIALLFSTVTLYAQFAPEYIAKNDFDTYVGTTATLKSGWYASNNNASSGSNGSYYTSTQSSGASPNSYKFRVDSSYIITPEFGSDADSVVFWMKGNSVDTISAFNIYEGVDTNSFVLINRIDHIALAGTRYSYPIQTGSRFVKFMYEKSAGNVAFDDVEIFANGTVGISKSTYKAISIIPTISTTGEFKINGIKENSSIEVYDVLGNKISYKNVAQGIIKLNSDGGCYFVKVTQDSNQTTCRVIIQ